MVKVWKRFGKLEILAAMYGKWFRSQTFLDPHGQVKEYASFGHPDSVDVLAVTVDGQVVLVREFMQGVGEIQLWTVGANPKGSEEPETTARRALMEETGYMIGQLTPLGTICLSPRHSPTKDYLFLATDCTQYTKPAVESDLIEVVTIPVKEWFYRVVNGEITNPFSVAVTVRAMPYLGFGITGS